MNEPRALRLPIAASLFQPALPDRRLPRWARRGHPVVQRQLGFFWKIMTPDFRLTWQVYVFQVVLIAISVLIPAIFTLLLPVIVVPVMLLPFAFYAYGEALYRIGAAAAASVAEDQRARRLDLLRTTPLPLREILLAKGAAAVWRQVESLDLLLVVTAFLSLPMVLILNTQVMQLDEVGGARLLMIVGLTASLLRIVVEPPMIAALGVLMGSVSRDRIPAMLATGALGFAYFVMINLLRLAPLSLEARLVVEVALPLVLPPLITLFCLWLAERALGRE